MYAWGANGPTVVSKHDETNSRNQSRHSSTPPKLSIIQKDKIAQLVVNKFSTHDLRSAIYLLKYEEEANEVVLSLNSKLANLYEGELIKQFPVFNGATNHKQKNKTVDELIEFGSRLILSDPNVRLIIAKVKLKDPGATLEADNFREPLQKGSLVNCQLSMGTLKLPFCDLAKESHLSDSVMNRARNAFKKIATHIENDGELAEVLYDALTEARALTEDSVDGLLIRNSLTGLFRENYVNLSLALNMRELLSSKSGQDVLRRLEENNKIGVRVKPTPIERKSMSSPKKETRKAPPNIETEFVVALAQIAKKVVQDFDYPSFLEILPALSTNEEFEAALDSFHEQLFPTYAKELKQYFESEHKEIQAIDRYLEQCKKYGEKLILQSEKITEVSSRFSSNEPKKKSSENAAKKQESDQGEVRIIEKTHSWKELNDDF